MEKKNACQEKRTSTEELVTQQTLWIMSVSSSQIEHGLVGSNCLGLENQVSNLSATINYTQVIFFCQ